MLVHNSLVKVFTEEAQKRGYNNELTQSYVNERKTLNKKIQPLGDVAVGATALATAGSLALKTRKMGFVNALCHQFSTLFRAMNKFNKKAGDIAEKLAEKPGFKSEIQAAGKSALHLLTGVPKLIWGLLKSAPIQVSIPAGVLFAGMAAIGYVGTHKINKKYDALQKQQA